MDVDLQALKAKQEAGADFCITQLFFNVEKFFAFVDEARLKGITIPIIPGIMPIQLFSIFDRTTKYLKTNVPQTILDELLPIKDNDEAVRTFGISLGIDLATKLLAGGCVGVHFFTLNLEKSVSLIVEHLQRKVCLLPLHCEKPLPWKQSMLERRAYEDVRPIFWSNKPRSYVERTKDWDEFPNGRWGDLTSPAYGSFLQGSHYYQPLFGDKINRLSIWGIPLSIDEVAQTFIKFLKNEIPSLPWTETGLHLETGRISDALIDMNQIGCLTINSQPSVNGEKSNNDKYGWGPENGRVYQKAYLEFFVSEKGLLSLKKTIDEKYPSLSYFAVNVKGHVVKRQENPQATAVTWGVFPNREIIQPTIVDPVSFLAWKDEAFQLWVEAWASVYDETSASYSLLWGIHDSFYLVNIVDEDYVDGDIFKVFQEEEVRLATSEGMKIKIEE